VDTGERVTDFYTQVVGEVDGVWALQTPRIVRQRVERRATVRVPMADQDGLTLEVMRGGHAPVIDVSPGGLSFRCDLAAPWARMHRPFRAMLRADGEEPVALRLEIQHLRLDPGDSHWAPSAKAIMASSAVTSRSAL
jgi:hypothetical protein